MAAWNPRANDIFLKALESERPEDRRRVADEACAGDAELRAQVDSLLRASERAGSFLEAPADGIGPEVTTEHTAQPPSEGTGSVIGPYKLLEQIGEGGMGVVFLAEQQHPVRRKVALKVIKPGCDTRQVIARFEAERQALAMMDHPNIARVFDAGATEAGRPYFVMELVHGVPITEFCDKKQLPPRERLELFVQVCRAVQHAHTKGIIHRDIKPNNVLVTLHEGVPLPKVIDFGIAKATGQQLTEKTLFTQFAQMVGTPLYMSPEQAELTGADVDARTDVYSLGVLLYELLTGTTPVDKDRLKQAAFDEVLRIIREEEPQRPSTRLSTMGEQSRRGISAQRNSDPKQLGQLFRRELDWVVMKAMEKDRGRRYETASALAADVRHFLENEPVSARPASALYRLRKFASKHKVGFGAAAAVAAALVLGVAGTTLMMVRATRARDRAVTLSRQLDQQRGEALAAKARAEEARAQAERDRAAMQVSEDEASLAMRVLNNMLTAANADGHEPDVTVRQMIDRGVQQVERQQPPFPAPVEGAVRHILGTAYAGLGKLDEAETQLRKALHLRRVSLPPDHPAVAGNLSRLGAVLVQQRKFDEALPLLEQALQIHRVGNAPLRDVQFTLTWLQSVHTALGRQAEAEEYARENAGLRAKLTKDPTQLRIDNLAAESDSASGRGDHAGAERLLREAIGLFEQAQKDKPDRRLVNMYHNLGVALDKQDHPADAEATFRQSLALSEKLFGADNPQSSLTLANLAIVLRAQGKQDEAGAMDVRRLGIYIRRISDAIRNGPDNTNLYRDRAYLLCRSGRFKEAIADFEKAIQLDPDDHWKYYLAAEVCLYVGDLDRYHRYCREMVLRFKAAEEPEVIERVAKASLLEPDPEADIEALASQIEKMIVRAEGHTYSAWFRISLGLAEYRRGRYEKAIEAISTLPEKPPNAYGQALSGIILAMAQARSGQASEARKTLDAAEARIDPLQMTPGTCDLGFQYFNFCTYQILRSQAESVVNGKAEQGDVSPH